MNTFPAWGTAFGGVILIVIAVVTVAIRRYRMADIEMGAWEFFRRMLRISSYGIVGPAALQRKLELATATMTLVDLRSPRAFAAGHISGATHSPFDDFLKAVVVDRHWDKDGHKEIVLICDTGHMSRVAAEIMVEDEGFKHVSSLRGGMTRWQRWTAAQRRRSAWCCGFSRAQHAHAEDR